MMKELTTLLLLVFLISCGEKSAQVDENITATDSVTVKIDSFKFLSDQIANDSKNAENWYNRSIFFYQKGKIHDARIDLEKAVLLDSTNALYRTKYGNILIDHLDLQNAKYNFEYALKVDSLHANAYVGLGKVYALINNPGMATVYLNKAYKINPHIPEAYFLEGMIYKSDFHETRREESWKRAKSAFQTVIEQNPRYYSAYIMLGTMNETEGTDLGIEYFNSAIQIAPQSSDAWYKKAMFYQNREKFEQAKYCYRKIISFDSTYIDAYYNQGFLNLSKTETLDSAIYFYKKILEIDSTSIRAYNDLGLAYEDLGDKEKAIIYYKKALAIDPTYEIAKKNLRIVKNK